jgi:D-alanyl-lipoteichoic acid acyltransferase DltB (MBOAT superfamily)
VGWGLAGAIACAPLYWVLVPARWRRDVVAAGSLIALGLYDARVFVFATVVAAGLALLAAVMQTADRRATGALAVAALAGLASFFVWNKLGGGSWRALGTQQGLVVLGGSYVVLKAAAAVIDAARGELPATGWRTLLAWIAFLPTYPAGPMAELGHFAHQAVLVDRARVLAGCERILFGLVKAVVAAHYLGQWADPVVAHPEAHGRLTLLVVPYALALRFYLDFAGYSDIAIGLAALYGFDIEENFDRPFGRRNLVQLWQHWHMTLTRWLRVYLFIPITRRLLRAGGSLDDRVGIVVGQLVTMTFCGLWHGLAWHFALWGLAQGIGLAWVAVLARPLGQRLPGGLVSWWRTSPVAAAGSALLTLTFFAATMLLVVGDVAATARYLRQVAGR